MKEFVLWYLSVGASLWIIFVIKDAIGGFKNFKKASALDVARGFLGCLMWPYILYLMEIK